MKSTQIRHTFIEFFKKRGHAEIPSASLIPENDPSVLFNTAGMQPLVPYLLGQKHPLGNRLVNIQKCVRTGDIDDIGDNTHATFFQMMGNWSLGDYFKKDAIAWSYELLTSKEEGFGLDPNRLYVTVFEGDENAAQDTESAAIWKSLGIPEHRIYFMSAKDNWWSPGDNGPCGPDSEMFYDLTDQGIGDLNKEEFIKASDNQHIVEIWNDVFMEFEKKDGKVIGKLEKQNVDTGSGLERVAMVLQGKKSIFDTDLFTPILEKIDEYIPESVLNNDSSSASREKARRVIADHLRASVFMIADGARPSNSDQGYILRRLLRRAIRYADTLNIKHGALFWIADRVVDCYMSAYSNLDPQREDIKQIIDQEEHKFRGALEKGLKEFERIATHSTKTISGTDAFTLFSSFGFPIDMTIELAKEKGLDVDSKTFDEEFKKHQDLSRSGAEQKFKGGLAGTGIVETKYHTATHLLHAALRQVLGTHVQQKGSNITIERLRFDFTHPQKMTDEEKQKVEAWVNEQIQKALPVTQKEMSFKDAEKTGALHFFGEKYGDMVKVYSIGDEKDAVSMEFCGGPHVTNTNELGHFKISKEEAVSAGVRRIKAILE